MLNKYLFLVLSAVVCLALLFFIIKVASQKSKETGSILAAMICGFVNMPVYCITILSQNYELSYIAFSMNLLLVEWLTFFFFKFVAEYSVSENRTKRFFKLFFVLTLIDSLLLIVNIFLGYLFDITLVRNPLDYNLYYWDLRYKPSSALHYVLSYFYICMSVILLVRSTCKVSSFYKIRFLGILIAYLSVVFVHLVCLLVHIQIDFSILLYGLMGAFVSYYITYTAPHQLLYQILQCYNQSADEALLYFDEKGKVLLANDEARKIFTREGSFSEEVAEEYCSNAVVRYVKIKHEKTVFKDSMIISGEVRDFEGEYQDFFDKKNLIGSYLRLEDKTLENLRYKKQQHFANNDVLTGIYNRDYFFRKADEIIQKDPYTPRLMICSNIIDFKLINEALGTDFGDIVLKKITDLIRKLSRADDVYCRVCDDKFAILMRKTLFDPEVFTESFKVVQRLTESELFQIKITVGIYEIKGDRESAQVVYDKAYIAMEKQPIGANQYFHYYDATFMDQIIEERNMISSFEDELASGNFKLYLSPLKDASKKTFAVEADSKWLNHEKGLLDSSAYIEIFEKQGIIYKLDRYIWEEAIRTISKLNKENHTDLRLLLQVSQKDTYYLDICQTLLEFVNKYECDPATISVEFLEESISQDFREINETFKEMQKHGFRILFNKFGSGQTSLNLLKETNLNGVKIDSSLIEETEDSEKTTKILKFIISLSNMLGLNPCISGVDTRKQFEYLKQLNIQGFQGLFCGDELPAGEFCESFKA